MKTTLLLTWIAMATCLAGCSSSQPPNRPVSTDSWSRYDDVLWDEQNQQITDEYDDAAQSRAR